MISTTSRTITLNVTNDCNLRCPYCFEDDKQVENMSIDDAILAVGQVYQPGLYVNFFGGEPLLNFPLIQAVVKKFPDCSYSLTSNLTLLTDKMVSFFISHKVHVLVSCDGLKNIHDANRCGTHDIVIANIKKLPSELVQVRMTVLPQDVPYVVNGIDYLVGEGVSNIAPVLVTDIPWTEEQLASIPAMVNGIFAYALEIYNSSKKINLSIKQVDEFLERCVELFPNQSPCGFGSDLFYAVGPAGDIYPCHQRPAMKNKKSELTIGNIHSEVNKKYQQVTDWQPESGNCHDCRAYNICIGWCPSQSLDQFGTVNTVPTAVCRYNQAMYDAVARYQSDILKAKNLRNVRLQRLKFNLRLLELLKELHGTPITEPTFISLLTDFYSQMSGNMELVLPSFKDYFDQSFHELASLLGGEK